MLFLWAMHNITRGECPRKTAGQQSRHPFIFNYKYFSLFDSDCRCLCGKALDTSKSECMDCLLRHNKETLEENPDQPPLQRDGWCKEVATTRSLIKEELNTQPTSNVP